mgnify:FL=1
MQQSNENYFDSLPFGRLGIIPLKSCIEMGNKVNNYLYEWRSSRNHELRHNSSYTGYERDSYIIEAENPRFGSGEAKGCINESVRGDDLYVMVDVCN